MTELKHTVRVFKGYDYRDDGRGGGAHGASMTLITQGPLGAVTFDIMTGWMHRPLGGPFVPELGAQPRRDKPGVDATAATIFPIAYPVVIHSVERTDPSWYTDHQPCLILGTDECWGIGNYGLGDGVLDALVEHGDEAAFSLLDGMYHAWLGAGVES